MIQQLLLNGSVSNHTSEHVLGRVANLSVASLLLLASLSAQAAPTVTNADPAARTAPLAPNAVLAPNTVNQLALPNTASNTVSATAANQATPSRLRRLRIWRSHSVRIQFRLKVTGG